MTDSRAWVRASSMAYGLTATYASEPTVEELKSELASAQASHQHANRALTNMAVALSDETDRVLALQDTARKTKLKHDARRADLEQEIMRLCNERKQADESMANLQTQVEALRAQVETLLGGKKEP